MRHTHDCVYVCGYVRSKCKTLSTIPGTDPSSNRVFTPFLFVVIIHRAESV